MLSKYKKFFEQNLLTLETDASVIKNKILKTHNYGGKIIFLGNGGSFQGHMAHDFLKVGKIKTSTPSSPSLLTCLTNDYGQEKAFAEWLKVEACSNDLVILISSSGESKNLINAAIEAENLGCYTIGITGFKANNTLSRTVKWSTYIDAEDYGIHEITSEILLHSILDDIVKERNV